VMALTIAAITLAYCLIAVGLTHTLAERMRAHPLVANGLERLAGGVLLAFGVKLALGR
jgi:leucine efflux protein